MTINCDRLLALLGNDESRVDRFVANFKANLPNLVKTIRESFEKEDWESASIACHDLKNQANYLGLDELAALCYALEQNAEANEMPDSDLLITL